MNMKVKDQNHILCIDDDDKIRDLITKFLIKNNFHVSSANSSFDAHKLIKFYNFDLIILDIMSLKLMELVFLKNLEKKT